MEPQHNDIKRPAPAPATVLPSEADRVSPSSTKRPRVWDSHSTELSTNVIPECGTTILDVLNADCWRLVLDYVYIGDVVRSERVSRAWQRVVRDYLADKEILEVIAANCPNLKKLKLRLLPSQEHVQFGILNKCKQLKDLSFDMRTRVFQKQRDGYDDSLKEIFANENLEGLAIVSDKLVTGSFLTNLKTNLKTLIFSCCDSLLIEHIISVSNRLTGLTRLELIGNSTSTLQNLHLLLNETPNLERFCLEFYENHWRSRDPRIILGNEVPTAISRLSRLRELRLWRNKAVTDEWLAIVASGCPALRSIDVGYTYSCARGLRTLCQARPELAQLVVSTPFVKDEDLEFCARYCRSLELLDVSYCRRLTRSLPARLAWPRARPLRLRMYGVFPESVQVHCDGIDGITLLLDKPRHSYWPD